MNFPPSPLLQFPLSLTYPITPSSLLRHPLYFTPPLPLPWRFLTSHSRTHHSYPQYLFSTPRLSISSPPSPAQLQFINKYNKIPYPLPLRSFSQILYVIWCSPVRECSTPKISAKSFHPFLRVFETYPPKTQTHKLFISDFFANYFYSYRRLGKECWWKL